MGNWRNGKREYPEEFSVHNPIGKRRASPPATIHDSIFTNFQIGSDRSAFISKQPLVAARGK
jgi:hypothetical protein